MIKNTLTRLPLVLALLAGFASTANADLLFDQNVTPDVIFGSGNANGAFTVEQDNGVELALRAKLRHNSVGSPENTFNSNGDGTYTFDAGVAPTQSFPTAVWSFEWSINSDFDGSSTWDLDDLTYTLSMTSSTGSFITPFDPINGLNGGGTLFWDHAIGDNSTGNGGGTSATTVPEYATLIANNNVAQNSWKPHWFATGFDPEAVGTYDFVLTAFDGINQVASTQMTVNVVPEPASAGLIASCLGLVFLRRRKR